MRLRSINADLDLRHWHSSGGDLLINFPKDKVIIAIDALSSGAVPFKGLDPVLGPAFVFAPLISQLRPLRPKTKLIFYLAAEGKLVAQELAPVLVNLDLCLTYTACVRNDLEAIFAASRSKSPQNLPILRGLGHGSHDLHFFSKKVSRSTVFGSGRIPETAFVVLNANAPYLRKRLDLSIAAFAQFAKTAIDAYLVLHTGKRNSETDEGLKCWIAATGLSERILLSPVAIGEASLSDGELNDLYNACDVGLSTSMGEGWGLTAFEHALTRHAQILPNHTSFAENWAAAALLVACGDPRFIFFEYADMFPPKLASIVDALQTLYEDTELRQHYARLGCARAVMPNVTWAAVGLRLLGIVDELLRPIREGRRS